MVGARTAATHSADEHITSEPAFIAARPLSEGGADLPRQPISGTAIPTVTSWGMKGMLKCYQIGNLAGPGA